MRYPSLRDISLTVLLAFTVSACSTPSETSANSSAIEAPLPAAAVTTPAPAKPDTKTATPVTIPAGTAIRVLLVDGLSSERSAAGEVFLAVLSAPVTVKGKTVLEKGASVQGRVVDVSPSGRVKGRASLDLKLTNIERKNGKNIAISTKTYSAVAKSTTKRDAGIVGGGAGVGAIVGAIAGGGKGAAIGSAVGAGAGAGAVLTSKGAEIHYPPETRLTFRLSKALEL